MTSYASGSSYVVNSYDSASEQSTVYCSDSYFQVVIQIVLNICVASVTRHPSRGCIELRRSAFHLILDRVSLRLGNKNSPCL